MAFDVSLLEPVEENAGGFDPSLLEPIEETPQPAQRPQLSEWTPTLGERLKMGVQDLAQKQPLKTISEIPGLVKKEAGELSQFGKALIGKNEQRPMPPSPLATNWLTGERTAFAPENIPSGAELSRDLGINKTVAETASAIDKTVAGLAEFMTSPEGQAQVATYGVPILSYPMAAKWITDMVKGGYLSIKDAISAFQQGDTQKLRDSIIGATANFVGALGVGGHAASGVKNYFNGLSNLETVAPPVSREAPAPMVGREAIIPPIDISPILTGASLFPLPKGANPAPIPKPEVSPELSKALLDEGFKPEVANWTDEDFKNAGWPYQLKNRAKKIVAQYQGGQNAIQERIAKALPLGETPPDSGSMGTREIVGDRQKGVPAEEQGTAAPQGGENGLPQDEVTADHPIIQQKAVEQGLDPEKLAKQTNQEMADHPDAIKGDVATAVQIAADTDRLGETDLKSKQTPSAKPQAQETAVYSTIGKDMGFSYDGKHEFPGIKPLLSFTFRDVPESDPVHGATFSLPEGATPEQILTKAKTVADNFRSAVPIQITQPEVETKNAPVAESVATPTAQGSFKGVQAFRQTGAASRIVEIDKPTDLSGPGSPSIPQGPGARTFQPSQKPESYDATSLKNAVAELERAGLGLPESTPTERQGMAESWIRAGNKIAQDPTAGKAVADAVIANPKRGLSADESALLLRHKVNLFNALNDVAEKTMKGDEASRVEAKAKYARLTDEFNTLLDAIKARGSEWGREGRWRQAMAYEDYTMATQERLLSASLGRALTNDEREGLMRQIAEHKRLNDELTQHLSQRDQRIAEMEVKAALDKIALEAKPEPVEPHIKIIADKIKGYFDARADAALKRLQGKTFTISPDVLADLTDLGVSRILSLGIKAGEMSIEWANEMKRLVGERVVPHLKLVWDSSQKALEMQTKKMAGIGETAAKVKRAIRKTDLEAKKAVIAENIGKKIASGKRNEITNAVQRLARIFVEQGIKTRDGLTDAVHSVLTEIDPTFTRYETQRAIAGYGEFRQLSKDQVSVELRTIKGQLQQVLKLQNMQEGRPPLKTGFERRQVTREESKLIQQVNDAKRKFQVPIDDPETQLRSSLDELKKRMQTRIADLQEKIDSGDYSRKPKPEPIKLDQTALRLQADKLRLEKTFRHNRMLAEMAQRKWWQKGADTFVKWERAFKLSSPVVFGKLGAAAITRVGATALEEPVGGVLSKLPYISRVAARAPREGGLNVKAMAHGITEAISKGMNDAWQTARRGETDIDVAYGDKILDKDWANFFGQLHGMMKAPIKRAEFTLSLDKRIQHAINNGIDVTDPLVQARIATEALNDGFRSIFMQRGFSSDMFNQAVGMMEKSKKYPVAGEVTARVVRFLMPVVRVPLNIIGETATGIYGTPVASARTMFHAIRGTLDTLDPTVADSIMRQFKKGSIGLGLMAIGYFNPTNVGGYDWRQKRKPGEVKTSAFQIGGVDIPRWATHAPWFELMQIGSTIRRVSEEHISHTATDKGFTYGTKAAMLGLVEESPFIGQILRADKVFGTEQEQTQYWGQLAQSTIDPQLLIQAAKLSDLDNQWNLIERKPKTVGQFIEAGIPGLRQNIPAKGSGTFSIPDVNP